MKKAIALTFALVTALPLIGCGEARDSVQPGSPQWEASRDKTQQQFRDGKDVTLEVPSSMIHPGVGGTPPPNVKIKARSGN